MSVPTVKISSCASLLALVPQLLAFEPRESLVAVFLAGNRVAVTMRVDLKDLTDIGLIDKVEMAVEQVDADSTVLIAYTDDENDDLGMLLSELQLDIAARMGRIGQHLEVVEAIAVNGDRWRSLVHGEAGSMEEVRCDPVAVRGIVDGVPVSRDREALADLVRPGTERSAGFTSAFRSTLAEMVTLSDDEVAQITGEHLDAWWRGAPADGSLLGRLVALGTHEAATPVVLARITTDTARRIHPLWAAAARCSQGSAALLPLLAAGASAWAAGDGATMNVATDFAAEIDRENVMVRMLRVATDHCLSPDHWDRFVETLDARGADR